MRARLLCLALAVLLVLQASPASAQVPFNLSIAKSKHGTYKSGVLDNRVPPNNPQRQTKKIEPGQTATFYVKVKNFGELEYIAFVSGDSSTADFDVKYFLNGEDVTSDYAGACRSTFVPAEGKVLFKVKIKATGATVGDADDFAMVGSSFLDCTSPFDVVWATVNVV